jgi:phospholipase C
MGFDQIQHVFVLMLENRSFDHLLGFSGISGTDAVTGSPTSVQGLSGTETNIYNGVTETVSAQADYAMAVDPGHEFTDVLANCVGRQPRTRPAAPIPRSMVPASSPPMQRPVPRPNCKEIWARF